MWGSLKEWGHIVVEDPIRAGDTITKLHAGARRVGPFVEHRGIITLNSKFNICHYLFLSKCLFYSKRTQNKPPYISILSHKDVKYSQNKPQVCKELQYLFTCRLCLLEWEHQPIHPWEEGQWRTSCSTCSTVHCWLWHIRSTIEMFDYCTFIGGWFNNLANSNLN